MDSTKSKHEQFDFNEANVREKIKAALSHGEINLVAKSLDYSRGYISQVLNGHSNNEDIIWAFCFYLNNKHKRKQKKRNRIAKKLVSNG